jgi:hypothetical protein
MYSIVGRLLYGIVGALLFLQWKQTMAFSSPSVVLHMVMLQPSHGINLPKSIGRRGGGVKELHLSSSTAMSADEGKEKGFFGKVWHITEKDWAAG